MQPLLAPPQVTIIRNAHGHLHYFLVTTGSATTTKNERKIGGIVGGTIGVLSFLVCITAIVVFIVQRRSEKEYMSNALELEERSVTKVKDVIILNRLGGGTYSDVYKGEWQVREEVS